MSHKFRAICLHPVNATPWGSTSDRQDSKSRNSFCDFCAFCGELPFFTKSHLILEKAEDHVCRQNDLPHCQYCKTLSRMIRPARRGPGSRTNGSFPKGARRLSENSPAGYPPSHHRDDPPGSAGVPPASSALGCRSVSLRWRTRPPCRREPHGHGPSRARASLPVDPGRGDGRGFASVVRAGRPRSRVGFLP